MYSVWADNRCIYRDIPEYRTAVFEMYRLRWVHKYVCVKDYKGEITDYVRG